MPSSIDQARKATFSSYAVRSRSSRLTAPPSRTNSSRSSSASTSSRAVPILTSRPPCPSCPVPRVSRVSRPSLFVSYSRCTLAMRSPRGPRPQPPIYEHHRLFTRLRLRRRRTRPLFSSRYPARPRMGRRSREPRSRGDDRDSGL